MHPLIVSHGHGSGFASEFIWDGCRDYAPLLGVSAALRAWRTLGAQRVRQYERQLLAAAVDALVLAWRTGGHCLRLHCLLGCYQMCLSKQSQLPLVVAMAHSTLAYLELLHAPALPSHLPAPPPSRPLCAAQYVRLHGACGAAPRLPRRLSGRGNWRRFLGGRSQRRRRGSCRHLGRCKVCAGLAALCPRCGVPRQVHRRAALRPHLRSGAAGLGGTQRKAPRSRLGLPLAQSSCARCMGAQRRTCALCATPPTAVHIYNELADYERLAAAVLRIACQEAAGQGTS